MAAPGTMAPDAAAALYERQQQEYRQAQEAYNSNPLRARVQAARREADAIADPDQRKALYDRKIAALRTEVSQGIEGDLVNQASKKQAQQELMNSVMSLNPMGIMSSLMKMISGGNELLNVPGQLAGQLLQQRGVDPQAAIDNSFMTSAVASGLMGAGVDVSNPAMQQYIGGTVAQALAPLPVPAPSPAAVLAAANSAPGSTGPAPAFVAPNGALPPAPVGTPPGRPAAPAGTITIN